MDKNSSTKDLTLSSNERLYLKKKSLFKYPIIKNFTSSELKFYTFHAGFKKKHNDVLFVVFNEAVSVSAVYSKTSTPSAPIIWDKKNNKGLCKILIINSGNANAHTGDKGIANIDKYAKEASVTFKCPINQVMVSSTGVIGEQIQLNKILKLYPLLSESKETDLLEAARSIMTTDTYAKMKIKTLKIGEKKIRIFGFAKGSGMIYPNMGTMLAYIFIEAKISKNILKKLLISNLDNSFNSISVDGDTSTSDTVMLFSLPKNNEKNIITEKNIKKIEAALKYIMHDLAIQVVSDGEGISKLIEVNISGAKTYRQASAVAFSIANSPLVKTAIAGGDANWGRVIMAIGKADLGITQKKIKLKFGKYYVATNGQIYEKINFKKLDSYMKNKKIQINVNLGIGKFKRKVYASDLTHEYIRINADYRS